MTRKVYYDFDKDVVNSLDKAIEICQKGDPTDFTICVLSNLMLDGFEIRKKEYAQKD